MARVFVEHGAGDARNPAAECSPPLDVIDTPAGLEILMDLPGIPASLIEVVVEGDTLIIAGQKQSPACEHDNAGFHLAERAFGRFARTVDIDGAHDASGATATLAHGELRIVLPRLHDRRGRRILIPIRG